MKVLIGAAVGVVLAAGGGGAAVIVTGDEAGPCYVERAAKKYPGDDASRGDIARWMAAHAADAGLPRELPVLAALVESDVRNLERGDDDSAGFFQIRVGIWNKGEYDGFPERAELQLRWFLDRAIGVKTRLIQEGVDTRDEASYGEWVADVERPAEGARGRYQLRLDEARRLLDDKT